MAQTGSWVVSQKRSLVERNGRTFGPSGLYMYTTDAKYCQNAQTGSHMVQTGSWIISGKQSLVERNGQKFEPSGLYITLLMPNIAKTAKQEVTLPKQEVGSYLGNGAP